MNLKIEVRGIRETRQMLDKELRDFQERVMDLVLEEAPRFTPKRTGRAARGWEQDVRQGKMEVVNRVPYVRYLEKPFVKSKQAPEGIIGPTLTSVERKIR